MDRREMIIGAAASVAASALPLSAFGLWKIELATELSRAFDTDGADYIRQTGDDCWREMFDDGLSPEDAVWEEVQAAISLM